MALAKELYENIEAIVPKDECENIEDLKLEININQIQLVKQLHESLSLVQWDALEQSEDVIMKEINIKEVAAVVLQLQTNLNKVIFNEKPKVEDIAPGKIIYLLLP